MQHKAYISTCLYVIVLVLFNAARRLKQINQLLPTHTLQEHKQDNFHFSAPAPYTGRTIQVREIMPQHPRRRSE